MYTERPDVRLRYAIMTIMTVALAGGCERVMYDPGRATRPYPQQLHRAASVDIQVFRDGPTLEIVNSSPRTFRDCDVWINQRYVDRVAAIPAGATVRLSLWGFYDERGDRFSAGGFWRTERATPVRLVELQVGAEEPLIGLVTIPER